MTKSKIQAAIEQHKAETEAAIAVAQAEIIKEHENNVSQFGNAFVSEFNALFKGICTFFEFSKEMNEKGWDVSFNVGDNRQFVVFTPIHIEKRPIIKSMRVTTDLWSLNGSFVTLSSTPIVILDWLVEVIGEPKEITEIVEEIVPAAKPINPKYNLPCNILVEDMTLLDHFAGQIITDALCDTKNAYELAAQMLVQRQEYFED